MTDRIWLRRWTGERVAARLVPRLGEAELRQIEGWQSKLRIRGEVDAEWDWRAFVANAGTGAESGALVVEGRVEAAFLLSTIGYKSRQGDGPLVYLDYMAVAPENRDRESGPRQLRGCGSEILRLARYRSRQLGYEGRVGLHSLSTAESFYVAQGMRRWEPMQEDDGYVYFEWPTQVVE